MRDLTAEQFELLHNLYYEEQGEAMSWVPVHEATKELQRRKFVSVKIEEDLAYVTVTQAGWRALLS